MIKFYIKRVVSVSLSVVASVLAVAAVGFAATTISTNVNTGGTLTVTGAATISGNLAFDGTSATTTISGGLRADTGDNTFVVDFSSSTVGIGTTSPSALLAVHGNAIFGSANGSIVSIRAGTVNLTASATTTVTTSAGININSGDLVLDTASNKLYVGTSTPIRGNLAVEGSGTTTLVINSTTAAAVGSAGSCIELKAIGGATMHMYATSTDNGYARLEKGSCTLTETGI